MKNLLLVVGIIVSLVSCASPPEAVPPEQNIYQEVVEVDKSQDELYLLSNKWLVERFVSAKAVIEYQDKETGTITGNASAMMDMGAITASEVRFNIVLEVKENKARITFKNMHFPKTGNVITDRFTYWSTLTHEVFIEWAIPMIENYKEYLASESSDW